MKTAYLVFYNVACMLGWAYCLVLGFSSLIEKGDLSGVYEITAPTLLVVQWAMCMEVLHAALGLVSSPVKTTFLQVLSRVVALTIANEVVAVQTKWSCGLMVLSWSLVEVPRYAFYVFSVLHGTNGVPYPIFFLRYSLFYVLYPSGITGEVVTMYSALPHMAAGGAWQFLKYANLLPAVITEAIPPALAALAVSGTTVEKMITFVLLTYVPGGPFMYMNMVGNRSNAFKKRFAPPPKPEFGTVFPVDDSGKGTRSTTDTGKKIFAASILGTKDSSCSSASEKCLKERSWRFKYTRHIEQMVRLAVRSKEAALGNAKAGLDWIYDNFEFIPKNGKPVNFRKAMNQEPEFAFHTGIVKGESKVPLGPYKVLYNGGWHPSKSSLSVPESEVLSGDRLKSQLKKWTDNGIIERDAKDAIEWTVEYFAKGNSLSHAYFVMIGAGSAMGPFSKLLEYGANIVAIDIPGKWGERPAGMWKRLIDTAKKSNGGSIIFPLDKPQVGNSVDFNSVGANLTEQPVELAAWLVKWAATIPKNAPVVIGNYTYLDSDQFVKLSLSADVLITALRKARPSAALAFLCTPTDFHVVPEEAHIAAKTSYGSGLGSFGLEKLINIATRGKKLVKNALKPEKNSEGDNVYLVDGLSVVQGPNYALAKRMQHWRAIIEYEAGATVSSMIAPSTATLSVLSNKMIGWAYGGMPYFGYEVFKQDTTNGIMAAILIHDVLNEKSSKNPKNRKAAGIVTGYDLFKTESVHGGLWRSPYKADSLGEVSALIYFIGASKMWVVLGGVLAVAIQQAIPHLTK